MTFHDQLCLKMKNIREFKAWPPMINIMTSIFVTPEGSAMKNIREFKVLYTWPPMINIMTSRFVTPEGSAMKNIREWSLKCYIHGLP
jgi:hypothetical protein